MSVGSHQPMRRVRKVHLIGIGGVGMAGIAEVLLNLGYVVSGSDLRDGPATRRLRDLGAEIFFGHQAANLQDVDVVVTSTAIALANPEVEAAHAARVPVVRRAEMLAELMRFRHGIAVAGTHGKTTTTSLIASVLAEGGLDPTFVIGGKLLAAGANAKLGSGHYLVAEADESDASFLHLNPMMAVVTNVDADHLETYGGEFSRYRAAFIEFLHRMPFYGLAVVCIDDPEIAGMMDEIGRPVTTYGTSEGADVRATDISTDATGTSFMVEVKDAEPQRSSVHLNLPGHHNVLNALAAVAIGCELDIPLDVIGRALTKFAGIGRRCEQLGELQLPKGRARLIDDYGHHPNEIAATVAAMRAAYPERRLVVAFQPHRYSRTRELFDDFTRELAKVDALVLTEVYPAGEAPIANADGRALARGIRARGTVSPVFVPELDAVPDALADLLTDGDLLLTLGAGSVGSLPGALMDRFGGASPEVAA